MDSMTTPIAKVTDMPVRVAPASPTSASPAASPAARLPGSARYVQENRYLELAPEGEPNGKVVLELVSFGERGLELAAASRRYFIEFFLQAQSLDDRTGRVVTQSIPRRVEVKAKTVAEAFDTFDAEAQAHLDAQQRKIVVPGV